MVRFLFLLSGEATGLSLLQLSSGKAVKIVFMTVSCIPIIMTVPGKLNVWRRN
jgi:hypothetical protein